MHNPDSRIAKELYEHVNAASRARSLQEHAAALEEAERRSKAAYTVAKAFGNLRERLEQKDSKDTITLDATIAGAHAYTAHGDQASLAATEQAMRIEQLVPTERTIRLPEQNASESLQPKA